jgi:NAD(P)-dependent dehydrogenase (short-subunit alcohol dehydrogenase family)
MATKSTLALVTGANKGIGRAIATQLARDHSYIVIIGSRSLAAGQEVASSLTSQGYQAIAVQLDVTSDSSLSAAVDTISQKYGRLDVLINNAGIFLDAYKEGVEVLPTRDLFTRTFDVNVTGPACLTDALVPLLRKAEWGGPRVLFVSSSMSSLARATNKETSYYSINATAYDCSKAALNMLALQYVRILEDVGGKSNVLCPGLVKTDLNDYTKWGTTPDEGASHIVEVATTVEGGPNGTFSDKNGQIPW